ncbi:hypothetical protein B0H14DRAFT_2587114 [Mycena olivaceomarginata]|nr:hypothetical protein B0H14DRAFT_2587114 [Mycena olivaceomarginata]
MQKRRPPRRLLALQDLFKRGKQPPVAILTVDGNSNDFRTCRKFGRRLSSPQVSRRRSRHIVQAGRRKSSIHFTSLTESNFVSLPQRVEASAVDAEMLAWRAFTILDEMYNSVGDTNPDTLPLQLLHSIFRFEQVLNEICDEMKCITTKGTMDRLLRLSRNESQLAKFTAKLDSAAQAFTIGLISSQNITLAFAVDKFSTMSSSVEQSHVSPINLFSGFTGLRFSSLTSTE